MGTLRDSVPSTRKQYHQRLIGAGMTSKQASVALVAAQPMGGQLVSSHGYTNTARKHQYYHQRLRSSYQNHLIIRNIKAGILKILHHFLNRSSSATILTFYHRFGHGTNVKMIVLHWCHDWTGITSIHPWSPSWTDYWHLTLAYSFSVIYMCMNVVLFLYVSSVSCLLYLFMFY